MAAGSVTWLPAGTASLKAALSPPARLCVEATSVGIANGRSAPRSRNRLCLSVTSRTAYRLPVAQIFAEAVTERVHLSADLSERVRTAVQEALMNALLHGSLDLAPSSRNSLESFALLGGVIEDRLAAIDVLRGAIHLDARWTQAELCVVIRDGGNGFRESDSGGPEPAPEDRKHGRGMMILAAMCDRVALLRGGSAVELRFRLDRPARPEGDADA